MFEVLSVSDKAMSLVTCDEVTKKVCENGGEKHGGFQNAHSLFSTNIYYLLVSLSVPIFFVIDWVQMVRPAQASILQATQAA